MRGTSAYNFQTGMMGSASFTTQVKPRQIRWAVVLLWITFAQIAVSILVAVPKSHFDDTIRFEVPILVVLLITLAFSIPKMSAGRNWARITIVIAAVFGVLFDVSNFQEILQGDSVMAMLDLAGDVCLIAAAYFLIIPPGSRWFTQKK